MYHQQDHGTTRTSCFVRSNDLWRPSQPVNIAEAPVWMPPHPLLGSYATAPPQQNQFLSLAGSHKSYKTVSTVPPRAGLSRFVSTHTRAILRSAPDRAVSCSPQRLECQGPRQSEAVSFCSVVDAELRRKLPPLPVRDGRVLVSSSPRTAAAEAGAKRVQKAIEAIESKPPSSGIPDPGEYTVASRVELLRLRGRAGALTNATGGGAAHLRGDLKPILSLDLSEKGKSPSRYVQLMFDDSAALEVLARTTQGETVIFRTASGGAQFRITIEPIPQEQAASPTISQRDRVFSSRRRRADEHLAPAHVPVELTPAPSCITTPPHTRRSGRASSLEVPFHDDDLLPFSSPRSASPGNMCDSRRGSGVLSEGEILEKVRRMTRSESPALTSSDEDQGIEAYVLETLVRNTVRKCVGNSTKSRSDHRVTDLGPPWFPEETEVCQRTEQINSGRVACPASISDASSDGRLYTPSPRPMTVTKSRGESKLSWRGFCGDHEDFGFLASAVGTDSQRPSWPSYYIMHSWSFPDVSGETITKKMVLGATGEQEVEPQYPCYCGCLGGAAFACTDGEMDCLVTKSGEQIRRTVSARIVGLETSPSTHRGTKSDGCSQISTDSEASSPRLGFTVRGFSPEDEGEDEMTRGDRAALTSILLGDCANYIMSNPKPNAPTKGEWSPVQLSVGSAESGDDDDQKSKTTAGAKMTRARKRREQRKRRRQRLRDEELAMLMNSTALESPYQVTTPPTTSHYVPGAPGNSRRLVVDTSYEDVPAPLEHRTHHHLGSLIDPCSRRFESQALLPPSPYLSGPAQQRGLNDLLREVTALMINQTVTSFD